MSDPIGPDDVMLLSISKVVLLNSRYLQNKKPSSGNVFYFIQDVSPAGMQRAFEIEERMIIPHGPPQLARMLGECLFDARGKPLLN